jgi:hypothetical protein
MKYIYSYAPSKKANAKLNGRYILVRPAPAKHGLTEIDARSLSAAIKKIKAEAYEPAPIVESLRSLTKRELVDRLIERNLATAFSVILESLPLEEKLRYDASPTISPDYAYIAENLTEICAALGIAEEEFKAIFR